MASAEEIIEKLNLQPLPQEGGYYVESYRSFEEIPKVGLPERYAQKKSFGTAIYYLLTPETFSALHRLPTDEVFHFYLGDPVTMVQLHPDGSCERFTLGTDIINGQRVQLMVPKGTWQGSFLNEGGKFALLGTTMAPGFDFSDYENGNQEELMEKYPSEKEFIVRLTSKD